MTVVRLQGGLGNQLFQTAAACYLQTTQGLPVALDASWYRQRTQVETPRELEIESVLGGLPVRTSFASLRDLAFRHGMWVEREQRPDDPVLLRARRWSWLIGYYQRAEYPLMVKEELKRRVFHQGSAVGSFESAMSGCVGIHVRLGDYLNPGTQGYHGLAGPEYFSRALEQLRSRGFTGPVVAFTDSEDVFTARYGPALGPLRVHAATGAWDALNAMASCRALVMSNSSLSWWAAFLGHIVRGTMDEVVFPTPWFSQPSPADTLLHVPSWSTLERSLP